MTLKRLSELKIADLKIELKRRGLSQQGKKAVLINKLKCFLNSSFLPAEYKQVEEVNELTSQNRSSRYRAKAKSGRLCFRLLNRIHSLEKQLQFLRVTITKAKLRRENRNKAPFSGAIPQVMGDSVHTQLSSEEDLAEIVSGGNTVNPDLCPNPKQISQKRIFFAGDANGDQCVSLSRAILNRHNAENILVTSFFKPNAFFDEVLDVIPKACRDFTSDDHIFIFAGTSDVLKGKKIDLNKVTKLLTDLYHTNVTLLGTTYCQGRTILNSFMFDFNCNLVRLSRSFMHVNYVETNKILRNANFKNYSPVLSYAAKKIILKSVLDMQFLEPNASGNLIQIPLIDGALTANNLDVDKGVSADANFSTLDVDLINNVSFSNSTQNLSRGVNNSTNVSNLNFLLPRRRMSMPIEERIAK